MGRGAGVITLALMAGCVAGDQREGARDTTGAPTPSATATPGTSSVESSGACIGFTREEWSPASVGAATFVVNRATRGMAARVRWTLAPDSSAMLVIEDPVGVENEAIPDGVLYATERTGRTWRMDSVWSATPSPDWTRIAFGRAVVLGGGEAQSVAPARWQGAARSLAAIAGPQPALVAESLRAHSYSVSGMAVVEGASATFVVDVARDEREARVRFASLDGWRVRWSCDGHDLIVGERPQRVQDDSPASSTRRVSVNGGRVTDAPSADSMVWVLGPTLDISVPVSRPTSVMRARDRRIEGRAGRIVIRDSAPGGWSSPRDVGPGVALAATRHGRFILAIAPRADARRYESPDQAVVYRVP